MSSKGAGPVLRSVHLYPKVPAWLHAARHPLQPVGWASIVKLLRLNCPPPPSPLVTLVAQPFDVPSAIVPPEGWRAVPPDILVDPESLEEHLAIAMEYEGPNLCILSAAVHHPRLAALVSESIEIVVKRNVANGWARRLWFLYEWMTEQRLDLPDMGSAVEAIDLLSPEEYYTALPILSTRHGVYDNLLGGPLFCPTVRRTPTLRQHGARHYGRLAADLLGQHGHRMSGDYSYDMVLQETIHSMAIEGVDYSAYDIPKLIQTLVRHGSVPDIPLDEAVIVRHILPAVMAMTEPPADTCMYRTQQVYVSETICTVDDTKDVIHFVAAKAEDCPGLMNGLFSTLRRLSADLLTQPDSIDCVVAASLLGFGFVFIHPFEDGNGRVHRFLIQHALLHFGYVPAMLLPLSRVILRDMEKYWTCLGDFDDQCMPHIVYSIATDGSMTVLNETSHLYRYFDCTIMAEYLYMCVETCVTEDLPEYCSLVQSAWDQVYT